MKKIIACPRCQQKIRLPPVFNKRLRLRCQTCGGEFDVTIQSPLLQLFSKNSKESFLRRFKKLPLKPKIILSFFFVFFFSSLVYGLWALVDFALHKFLF